MPQTLLAIIAMLMATFFAYQQQRHIIQTRMGMIYEELELLATAVAVDRLEEMRPMAFDDATKGNKTITSNLSLTKKGVFTVDSPPIDDIDDFHGSSVKRFRLVGGDTLWFTVTTNVSYAKEGLPDQVEADPAVRTKFKKASVNVVSNTMPLRADITLTQSFACGTRCAW